MHGYWGAPPPWLPGTLAYHKVGTAELGGTWCTRQQFVAQLEALCGAGYQSLDLVGYQNHLQMRHAARHRVLLTFDDAFESFADVAWPELQRRDMHAVLFVVTGFVGRRATWDLPLPGRRVPHLSWNALRDLAAAGVEIGSHSRSHTDLRRSDTASLQRELLDSRQQLQDELGVPVRSLSWPFGRCNARTCEAASAAGYELAFAMPPSGRNEHLQTMALPRRGVYVTDGPGAVLDKLDPSRSGFWFQDLFTRSVNAVATLSTARRRAKAISVGLN